jgi:hypothetical protein
MAAFQDAVDATFAAFGIGAVYTPAGGEPDRQASLHHRRLRRDPHPCRDGDFRIAASAVRNPRPGDQLTVGAEIFAV